MAEDRALRPAQILAAALALGLGVAFLVLDPARALRLDAAVAAGRALLAVGVWGLAALGAGAALLSRVEPAWLEDGRGLLHSLVAGLLIWGLGALLLAAAGQLHPLGLGLLWVALMAGWALRPRLVLPRPDRIALAIGAIAFLPGLLDALAPAVDTDELYYQLALPRELLRAEGLVGGLFRPDGNRPMILHLPYAAALALGGEAAPKLLHLAVSLGVLGATLGLGRRWLGRGAGEAAALLLLGSWSFLQETGLASNNLPTALAVLAALDAALAGRARALALAAGLALSLKYTAAGPLVGVFLVAALPWSRRLSAGLAALVLVSPWWLRNALEGLHPLFPFAGWPALPDAEIRFQYLEKYGAGRDWKAMLLLPWNAVMGAEIGSFRFLGRLSPAFLALLPLGLFAARAPGLHRRIGLVALCGAVLWAAGPHWIRHLLPALPVIALALGAALADGAPFGARLPRAAILLCGVLGLPANHGPVLVRAADRLKVASGVESREDFLARNLESWPAIAWCNATLPPDARVALLFDWDNALLERETLLGSVEDHVPTRYLLLRHGERSLEALVEAGATHVVVNRVNFLRKLYPFLDDATFEAEFDAPEALLDELLLRQGTLIFQHGRVRVLRLDLTPPKERIP